MPFLLLCAAAAPSTAPPPGGMDINSLLLMFAIIFGAYYFFIISPHNKKERAERQKLLDSVKKGDRVVTTAGIHGKVVDISKKGDMEIMTLECAPKVQIDFSRSALAGIVKKKEGGGTEANGADGGDSKSSKGKDKRG